MGLHQPCDDKPVARELAVVRGLAPVRLRSSRKFRQLGEHEKSKRDRFAVQRGQAPSPQASSPHHKDQSARCQLLPPVYVDHEAISRQRMPEQVALQRVAAQLGQEVLLDAGFHPFGDDPQAQRLA